VQPVKVRLKKMTAFAENAVKNLVPALSALMQLPSEKRGLYDEQRNHKAVHKRNNQMPGVPVFLGRK
jgi:hypothetical protein